MGSGLTLCRLRAAGTAIAGAALVVAENPSRKTRSGSLCCFARTKIPPLAVWQVRMLTAEFLLRVPEREQKPP